MANLKKCKACDTPIAYDVERCPTCGSGQGSAIIINAVIGVIFFVLLYYMIN